MTYNYPEQFTVEYIADCGESFLMENFAMPRISLYCDECKQKQYFYMKHIIHRSWEWDNIEDSLDDEDFFGDD